jgi:hypothetical protein
MIAVQNARRSALQSALDFGALFGVLCSALLWLQSGVDWWESRPKT